MAQILRVLVLPGPRFLIVFRGPDVINIESPVLDEVKELIRARAVGEVTQTVTQTVMRDTIQSALEARFGSVPADPITPLRAVTDEARLKELHRLAITCPSLDAFVTELSAEK